MQFRTHLIIILCITAAIYGIWYLLSQNQPVAVIQRGASPYSIHISRATWGLNCRQRYQVPSTSSDGFSADAAGGFSLTANNVLKQVGELCDGKPDCEIPTDALLIGKDPAPHCIDKELEVEYRCFSFDRPWRIRSISATTKIDCSTR